MKTPPDFDNMPPPVSAESFALYQMFRDKHGSHGKAMRAIAEYFAAAMIAHAAELDRP